MNELEKRVSAFLTVAFLADLIAACSQVSDQKLAAAALPTQMNRPGVEAPLPTETPAVIDGLVKLVVQKADEEGGREGLDRLLGIGGYIHEAFKIYYNNPDLDLGEIQNCGIIIRTKSGQIVVLEDWWELQWGDPLGLGLVDEGDELLIGTTTDVIRYANENGLVIPNTIRVRTATFDLGNGSLKQITAEGGPYGSGTVYELVASADNPVGWHEVQQ